MSTKRPVELAVLHGASMIFGAYVSEKTLSQDKLPGAAMWWVDGEGLYIAIKDKKTDRIYTQLLPYPSFQTVLFKEEEPKTTVKSKQQ